MVASPEEGAGIVKAMLRYVDVDMALAIVEDVWEEVGKESSNESLRDSILLLKDYLEGQWEYSLPIQSDTQFQDSGS
tara:strand:- start:3345 stop:3575 length:231 start_codon:yes stop_codon:yes gene_type:complete